MGGGMGWWDGVVGWGAATLTFCAFSFFIFCCEPTRFKLDIATRVSGSGGPTQRQRDQREAFDFTILGGYRSGTPVRLVRPRGVIPTLISRVWSLSPPTQHHSNCTRPLVWSVGSEGRRMYIGVLA